MTSKPDFKSGGGGGGEGRKNDDIQTRKVLQQQQEGNKRDVNRREGGGGRGQNYENRPRNRHSYYEGQDRRDNFQMHDASSANVPNAKKRGSQDEYSNYRNSRGGGGGGRELRRGQSFGFEGGFKNSGRGGGFGGDPRRSTSPQSLQWRTRVMEP